MKLHGNARLSVKGRELLVDRIEHAHRAQVAGPVPSRRAQWSVRPLLSARDRRQSHR